MTGLKNLLLIIEIQEILQSILMSNKKIEAWKVQVAKDKSIIVASGDCTKIRISEYQILVIGYRTLEIDHLLVQRYCPNDKT